MLLYVLLLLVNYCQHGNSKAVGRVDFESELRCVSNWQSVQLTHAFANVSEQLSLRAFWERNEDTIRQQTVEQLSQAVIYPRDLSKFFSCFGNLTRHSNNTLSSWTDNVSFDIPLMKEVSQLLGVRFISKKQSFSRLEFYMRPKTENSSVKHSLEYCMVDVIGYIPNFEKNYTCPRYANAKFVCSWQESGVYQIPYSRGFICVASTSTDEANIYAPYKFRIRSTDIDSASLSFGFQVEALGISPKPISQYGSNGSFTPVFISRKPSFLTIKTNKSITQLQWEDTKANDYQVSYTCQDGASASKGDIEKTNIRLRIKTSHRPLSCQVCVQALKIEGSLHSEPTCNTTVLPEVRPSEPPNITCNSDTCKSQIREDNTRDVVVTCNFPHEEKRNGKLTKLVINYWNDTSATGTYGTSFTTNLSTCKVNVKGLSQYHSYVAQMFVRNSAGRSDESKEVTIAAALHTNSSSTSTLWQLSLLGLVPLTLLLIGLWIYCRHSKAKQKIPLPPVEEPHNYDEMKPNPDHEVYQYDQFFGNHHNDNA